MKKGKKYLESAKLVDKSKLYDTTEAFDVLCKTSVAKFDETVEVHINRRRTLSASPLFARLWRSAAFVPAGFLPGTGSGKDGGDYIDGKFFDDAV